MNLTNPMLNQLNQLRGLPSNLGQIKNLLNLLKASNNPNQMLQQLVQNNPQIKNIIDYVQQNGGDPKMAFYKMAEEKGVNPNDIINMLR